MTLLLVLIYIYIYIHILYILYGSLQLHMTHRWPLCVFLNLSSLVHGFNSLYSL